MRPTFASSILFLALGGLAGCGSAGSGGGTVTPMHGGEIVSAGDAQGFAEVIRRDDPDTKGGGLLVAYFLDDGKRPVDAPADAVFKPKSGKTVPMKKATFDEKAVATPVIPGIAGAEGAITATVGGKPVTIPIESR